MTDEPASQDGTDPGPKPAPRAAARSAARLAAVQALFQVDSTGVDPRAAVQEFRAHRLGTGDADTGQPDLGHADTGHFAAIVLGASMRAGEIDALIAATLPTDWTLRRIDPVIRAILRAGCFELLARDDVPVRVAVDEYVSIAHAFFEGPNPGFANAMLDALARRIRPEAFVAGHDQQGG
jgi:N utilization substance protein B